MIHDTKTEKRKIISTFKISALSGKMPVSSCFLGPAGQMSFYLGLP